ncbi:uncharacterized protein N7458_005992 [Penicillium daleae]|uniref:Myb-like domain-containing protein n=1 Tax=Penicillium daleae TaxID=63821 RepID=A0AAD6C694_9EURO|nr:uncharacterized protein N7458_005992 [Penicillium daleae]KAJ5449543.1 hypothetical protein N7458_005992 [Penicillium daleae]
MSHHCPPRSQRAARSQYLSCQPSKVWLPEEDIKLIHLRSKGWQWPAISRMLPGKSQSCCRLRYKGHLNRSPQWTEERKDSLSREYAKLREHIWSMIGEKSGIPWRAAEAMHWHLGEQEIARRAQVTSFNINYSEERRGTRAADQGAKDASTKGEGRVNRAITLPSITTLFPDILKNCQSTG